MAEQLKSKSEGASLGSMSFDVAPLSQQTFMRNSYLLEALVFGRCETHHAFGALDGTL